LLQTIAQVLTQLNSQPKADIVLQALIILGATASLVVASGARQRDLSDRMRTLATEWRALAAEQPLTPAKTDREVCLLKQLRLFGSRCRWSVWAHRCLYLALIAEVGGFGFYFIVSLPSFSYQAYSGAACALIAVGMALHFWELWHANKTIDLELEDIKNAISARTSKTFPR
jgi:hypothetical protein